MKIRILSFLLVLAMVFTFMPLSNYIEGVKAVIEASPKISQNVTVNNDRPTSGSVVKPSGTETEETTDSSDVNAVAKIGDEKYGSFDEAVAAWIDGTTLTLLANVTLTETLEIAAGKTVTLDLNGKTISQTKAQTAGYQMILNDGNLTINDSVGNGKISYTDSGNGGEYISDTIYNRGVLVINGGAIENLSSATVASNGYPHAVDTYSGIRDTSVTVNGGTIYCAEYSAIRMFCVSATYKADLVINDGTVKGAIDMQNGTKDAALGSLAINGGVFETTKNANNIRFANWNGGATEYGIAAEINGGNFNGGISTQYVPAAANWDSQIIYGGTFNRDLSQYCADGYEMALVGEGIYDVKAETEASIGKKNYSTLKEAIAAAEAGDTILLKADVTVREILEIDKSVTIADYETYTIKFVGNAGITITNDANVTLERVKFDVSDAVAKGDCIIGVGNYSENATLNLSNVTVVGDGYSSAYAVFYVYNTSTLNITYSNVTLSNDKSSAGGFIKAEQGKDGIINITDTKIDLTDAQIGFLDGTVKLDGVELDIVGGGNAINQSALTVIDSTITVDGANGRALTLSQGDVTVQNSTLNFTNCAEDEIRFKKGLTLNVDSTSTIAKCDIYADSSAVGTANVNGKVVTGSETAPSTIVDATVTNPAVAKVGNVEYESLEAAIEAAKGATVTMVSSNVIVENIVIADGATVVIDLGGNTFNGAILPSTPASLTITNGSIINSNSSANNNSSASAIEVNAGALVLENVNISSARHGVRIDGAVTATINGGTYTLNATSGTRHAVNISGAANVTIYGGTFVGPKGTTMDSGSAVCVQAGAKATIYGGNFSGGKNATLGVSGTMTVYGGTFDQDPSAYVADGYIAYTNNGTYVVNKNVAKTSIYVNSAWANESFGAEVAEGQILGVNAFASFEDALNAVTDGATIVLANGMTGDESSNEIDFTKDISFTITGTAPNYALPVVTFQNATVTIKNAEILIPELDARQNATINVVDSIVHDAGGNGIVKSYYNGAINISGNSKVYTMQVTTMGYITISDTAELHATWQTNVYGNGMITVEDNAVFNTAGLTLSGQDYSGRDNTDADRVGKPAAIIVDGATFTVGKVYSESGADYSYNTDKYGINIGMVDGKTAVLDIKNGATVNVYTGNGKTANIGAGGTVNVNGSTLNVACRTENGKATLANNGTIYVTGASDIAATVTGAGWVYMNGVSLDADTKLYGAKVRFASGTNNIDGSVIDDGFFQVGIGAYNGVDANVDTVNGVVVNVKNAVIGSSGSTYAGWIGTGFYDTDAEKAAAMTDAKYVLNIENSIANFGYLHVSNDGELNVKGNADTKEWYNNSDYSFYAGDFIINGTATFDATDVLALYTKVSCDNGTTAPGTLNVVNGTYYEAERHNGAIGGTNFILYKTGVANVAAGAELYIGEYTTIAADAKLNVGGTVTALGDITNNGTITLTALGATITTPEAPEVIVDIPDIDDVVVKYENGAYKVVAAGVKVVSAIGTEYYETLAEAIAEAKDGDVITLLADCGETVMINKSNVAVTIDGAGKTFTGTIKINVGQNVTIKNVNFVHSGDAIKNEGSPTGKNYNTTLLVEGCTFTGDGNGSSVAIRTIHPTSVIVKNSSGTGLHSFMQNSGGQSVTIDGLTVENSKSGVSLSGVRSATVKNSTIKASDVGYGIRIDAATANAAITVESCEIEAFIPVVARNASAENVKITITGTNTMNPKNTDGLWMAIGTSEYDTNDEMPSAPGVKVQVVLEDTGLDKAGIYQEVIGLEGTGTEADPYLISSLEELIWFRDSVNTYTQDGSNQYKDKYVKLTAHIDLKGINWTPIGTNSVGDHMAFLGTFDGDGHTISNLYINTDGGHLGFFARVGSYAEDCTPTVKNIKFNNVDVSTNITDHWTTGHGDYVGGVIANAGGNSVVSGITVTGDVYIVGCGYVGGIVGHGYPDIDKCYVNANDGSYIRAGYWCAGGIIGYAGEGGTPITNSSVSGVDIWSAYGAAGAVAGLLQDGNKLENVSASNVEITSNSDYCMGYIAGNGEASTITNVTVTNVTATVNGKEISSTDAVAKVDETIYFNLADAIAAADGKTVQLLADVSVASLTIESGKVVTIDLNGNDLTLTPAMQSATITVNGELTLTGVGNVIVAPQMFMGMGFSVPVGGKLTLDTDRSYALGSNAVGSNLGSIKGELVINRGNFASGFNTGDTATVTITGGTFDILPIEKRDEDDRTIAISGGTFGAEIPAEWIAEGYELEATADGKYQITTKKIAMVGSTKYDNIDEAIVAWTNGTTLTLLADVTLSDVITLKSTEHHILNLGTYTMTAADGKNAIEIVAYGTGSSERNALTINADSTNPGGINAGSNAVVYYNYSKGTTTDNDRPIITINGGVFDGSTNTLSWGSSYTGGFVSIASASRKCPTFQINGGTFNCSLVLNRAKLIIKGGTFNEGITAQGDVTAYRLISGGTFKSWTFMTAGLSGSEQKFTVGNSKSNFDCGAYIDDNGYLVVGGPVITEPGNFEASSSNYGAFSNYLQYSSVKNNGLYYTDVYEALADNNKATGVVNVYVEELDLTDIDYKGTIVIPANATITITGGTPNVETADGYFVSYDAATGTYTSTKKVAQIGDTFYASLSAALAAAADGDTITLIWAEGDAPIAMNGYVSGKTVTITGTAEVDWEKGFLFVGRTNDGTAAADAKLIFKNANLTTTAGGDHGIHVSGAEAGSATKANGTVEIVDSYINLTYLINKGDMTLDNSTLTVKSGFSVGGRPASETESGEDATATITLNNNSKVVVNNHNGMGLGYEAIGVMNVNSGSTFETTQSFLITAKGTLNVNGGSVKITGTLTNKGTIVIDATGMVAGACTAIDATVENSGVVEAINNNELYAVVEDGKIVLVSYVAMIGDTGYKTLAEAFAAAQNGDEVEILVAGTYSVPTGKSITITGAVDGVEFNCGQNNIGMNGASVTFNNVTFNWAANGWPYHGLAHCGDMVYNDCTFNGTVFLYGNSETFNNCEFNVTGDTYNVWTYGAKNVEFNGCTFNSDGKSVLIYSEDKNLFNDVTVTDCDFIASAPVDGKAAIEMDSSLTAGINLTIDAATTATGFGSGNVSGNSLWNNKKGNNTDANNDITVVVGGETVLAPVTFVAKIGNIGYTTFADAYAAAKAGDTIVLYESVVITEDTILNLAGITVNTVETEEGDYVDAFIVTNGATLTINGGTVDARPSYSYAFYIGEKTGTAGHVVINDGNFYGDTSVAQVTKGSITINGGYFEATEYNGAHEFTINCWDANYKNGTATVTINGGSFYKFDPQNNAAEGAKTNFVPEKYAAVADGDNFKVVDAVAHIDGFGYATLAEAIAAVGAGNVVIELVADATFNYNARDAYGTAETTRLTINGNGHTLTLNQKNSDWSSIGLANENAKLVLNNMTIEKTGYGDTSGAWNTHAIHFDCAVEMNDVTVNNSICVEEGATLNNVTINEANGFYGLWIEGNGQTVTINGGAINATNGGRGIKIADQYIDAPASVTLTVDGMKFNTAKKAAVLVSSTAGAKITASNVDITKVAEDSVNFVWVDADWAEYYGEVTVIGGTKAQEEAEEFPIAVVDEDGNVLSYYKTLAEAIEAANGKTVTLLADIELTESIKITGTVTVDLNGKKLTGPDVPATSSYYAFIVDGGNLTLKDSVGTGEIWAKCYGVETKSGSFTMESGTITATNNKTLGSAVVNYGGTVTINGGTLSGALNSVYTGGYFSNASTTINGGTLNGPVVVEDWAAKDYTETVASATNTYPTLADYKWADDSNGGYILRQYVFTVATKAELNAALGYVVDGDVIVMTADIDYGTDQLKIEKAITLDLGGYTLTTRNAYGGMSVKNNPTIKNGTIVHASNTAAIKVWNAVAFEDLVIDVQGKGDANKTIGGIVLQSESTTRVDSIKNVTIKGAALTNGIETYNCGNATENVIGSMENVTIDAKGTGMLISAPCGTATNCTISGDVNGIEIWIKGTYSASLDLVNCTVEGGVFAHDEFSSNPSIVNNGKLSLTVDEKTTGVGMDDITLTIARAENVEGILEEYMNEAQAKVNDTYYLTINEALTAAVAGDTVTILAGDYTQSITVNKDITVVGEGTVNFNGKLSITADGATVKNISVNNGSSTAGYIGAKDVLIEGCTIVGGNGFRYCYTAGTVTFKDSTITGATYGIHFDGNAGGNIVIDNCVITGWTSFAGTIKKVTIKDTEFADGNYNKLRFYQDAELTNVTFNENMSIDFGKADVAATFDGCTVESGAPLTDVIYLPDIVWGVDITVDNKPVIIEAMIGEEDCYFTLADAIAAANDGDTVKLVGSYTGAGAVIDKNITIDLGGYTYTFNKTVGSTGTTTLGFQIKKGNNVTIKNGTLTSTNAVEGSKEVKVLIQNYANLTLTDVNLVDATDHILYVLSNNCGTTVLNGSTSITTDAVAFDVYDYTAGGYTVPVVNVNTTGTITGKIEVSDTATLAISGGTFTVPVAEAWCAEGYIPADNGDGTYGVKTGKYVARVNGVGYETLAEALEVAKAEENIVIDLYADATLDITAWQTLAIGGDATETITINGNGHTLTFNKLNSDWNHIVTNNDAKLILNNMTITDSGKNNGPWNRYDLNFGCDVELNNVTATKAVAFKADAKLNNVIINESKDAYAIWVQANGQTIEIDGLTVTSAGRGIKIDEEYVDNAVKVKLSIEDATFTTAKKAAIVVKSEAGAEISASNVNISGVAADTTNLVWVDEDAALYFGEVAVIGGTKVQESVESFEAALVRNDAVISYYKTLADAFAAAQDADEVVILKAGTYALSTSGKDITITGMVDGVVFDNIGAKNMGSANVTFNNVTFDYYPNVNYTGLQHSGNLVYNNCTINGQVFLYGASETFNNCTFNQNSADAYNVWTYGADKVVFNDCTFNSVGKSVLIYSDQAGQTNDVTIDGCKFIASAPVDGKAAIEMDSSIQGDINLTIDETTATGFGSGNVSGNSLWNNKKGNEGKNNDITVTVNGEVVLQPVKNVEVGGVYYISLAEAIKAAKDGDTVTLLANIVLTESIRTAKNVTVDLNGKKLTGPDDGKANWYAFIVESGTLTLKDSVGGGELYAKCYGVETKGGTFVMESGTITATQNKTLGSAIVNYGGTVIVNGGTISGSNASVYTAGYFADATTTINGGVLNGNVVVEDYNKFTQTVTSATNTYAIADDYKWVKDGDVYVLTANDDIVAYIGNTGYITIEDAIADAKGGDVVTLLDNIAVYNTIVIDKDIVLDLNEKTISVASTATYALRATTLTNAPVIRVLAKVTVKNGTVDGGDGINSYAFIVGNSTTAGELTIESGSYIGITSVVSVTNGVAYIKGGEFSTEHDGEGTNYGTHYMLNCNDANYRNGSAKIVVTGGKFMGFNPANNTSETANTSFVADGYHAHLYNSSYVVETPIAVNVDQIDATCTTAGTTAGTKCSVCDEILSGCEEITSINHVNTTTATVDSTCVSIGYKIVTCDDCGKLVSFTQIAVKDHSYKAVVVAPTCTAAGYTTYTCSACGDSYVADEVEATGHRFGNLIVHSATCTVDGYITIGCGNCGEYYDSRYDAEAQQYLADMSYINLTAKGHTEVVDDAVAPTCTATGLTEGSHCSVCNVVLVAQTVVEALGHKYEAVVTAPTLNNSGYTTYTCSVCGDSYIADLVPALAPVAQIGNVKYATLAEAIKAAQAGDTITLIGDVTENVTVSKSITIDGANFKYTGNISVSGSTTAVTVKNVNFVDFTDNYAITTNTIKSITVENCTLNGYDGFLYANRSTPTIVVKNVTMNGGIYGIHWVYGTTATLENVTMTNVDDGLLIQNYAGKTITLKNCDISSINVWEKKSTVQTFKFEGANTVDSFGYVVKGKTNGQSQYAKLVLADVNATLAAPAGLDVTMASDLDSKVYEVVYVDGVYSIDEIVYVAELNGVKYRTLQAAINAAQAGDTIVLIGDVTENVTVSKSITIDGAGYKYTGGIAVSGSTTEVTVKNVNFVDFTDDYAITTDTIKSITVENCTLNGYDGFLYANRSTPTIVVKNVTMNGGIYGIHWVYGTTATLENVTMTNVDDGLLIQNYAGKTITLKNCDISSINVWEKKSTVQTFKFEGANTVDSFGYVVKGKTNGQSQYAKLVLADVNATLAAPAGLTVTTNATSDDVNVFYAVAYVDGTYAVKEHRYVAQVGDTKYESLQAAINAASAGSTITLIGDVTENVTVNKSLTIDGAGYKYTGNIAVSGSTTAATVKNVNFVDFTDDYAITTNTIKSITVENCTLNGYDGFLYANKSTPTVVVKNVTMNGGIYGIHWVYGTTATLENVTMTNVDDGLLIQNYAGKTITLKNCDISSINVWEKKSTVQTFKFEGANTVDSFGYVVKGKTNGQSQYAKLVLADVNATLAAPAGLTVTTNVADYKVVYADGVYSAIAKDYVAQVGDVKYESLTEAVHAAQNGDTIKVLKNHVLDGSSVYTDNTHGYDALMVVEGKKITIDFGGFTVKVTPNATVDNGGLANCIEAVIFVGQGADLTLTGKGGITVYEGSTALYCVVYNSNSTLTIKGGTYKVEELPQNGAIIYADADNTTAIKGGNFRLGNVGVFSNTKPWIFNVEGKNEGNFVVITGGTFNQDPILNVDSAKDCEITIPAEYHVAFNKASGIYSIAEHTVVDDAAVDATCSATGLTAGSHCDVCGKVIVAQEVVEKLAHTEEILPAVEATFESTGLTEGKKCSVCGETLVAQEVIPVKVAVAQIGATKYESLADAINNATHGDVVEVLCNTKLSSSVTVGYDKGVDVTIDLNGYTVSASEVAINAFRSGTVLTIKNGTINGNSTGGTLVSTYNAKLVLGDNLVVTSGGHANAIVVSGGSLSINEGASVTVNGGINCVSTKGDSVNSITITGGTFSGDLYINEYSTCVITGGMFTTDVSEYVPEGYIVVDNGNGTWTVKKVIKLVLDSQTVAIGERPHAFTYTIVDNGFVTIPAGVKIDVTAEGYSVDTAKVGDTFVINATVSNVPDDFYFVVETGTLTVASGVAKIGDVEYGNLDEAIYAAGNDDVIVLIADIEYAGTVSFTKDITIDLNGHKLTAEGVAIYAVGGSIVDEVGGGLLVVPEGFLLMHRGVYPMLPVWVPADNGYIFVNVKAQYQWMSTTDTSFKIGYRPSLGNATLNTLLADGAKDNGLSISLNIHCIKEGVETEIITFALSDEDIAYAYSNKKMFTLTLSNATAFETYGIEFVIESDTGLKYSSGIVDSFSPVMEVSSDAE